MFDKYDVPDDEINKITHDNPMRLYQVTPFDHPPTAPATVGALRKAAQGHDVEIRALSHERTGEKTSFADFAANATAVSGAR